MLETEKIPRTALRASGNPVLHGASMGYWIPVFAGMTTYIGCPCFRSS
jgi:hypothetical protein